MKNNRPVDRPQEFFADNLSSLIALLDEQQPDIIGLQEVDFNAHRSWHQDQLNEISPGYHQAYRSINWNKRYVPFPYWPPAYHFGEMLSGQAVLSKFPIRDFETVVLQKPINAPFYYNAFYLDRLIQLTDVQIGDQLIKVMNVHLEAFDAETRESQARVVRDIYEQYAHKMPVILMGDFNSQPHWENGGDEVMETILASTNIASVITAERYASQPNAFYTFDAQDPYQMIDYILYTPSFLTLMESEVLSGDSEPSDHLAVLARFRFTDAKSL